MFCRYCGQGLPDSARFCTKCGRTTADPNAKFDGISFGDVKRGVDKVFDTITGDHGENVITFRDLFGELFKRHSKEDQDSLLVSGTAAAGSDPYRAWRKPWLFSRVFLVLAASFILLYLCFFLFDVTAANVIPGLVFIGALTIPFSLMMFFFETNRPRNISVFDLIKVFFVGGSLSLLLTFVIQPALDSSLSGIGGMIVLALVIGISEETVKLLAAGVFLRNRNGSYILNGLLVGAAVGAGFAVFETAGYAMQVSTVNQAVQVLLLRGGLSIGTHVVWSAIAGAALMAVRRPAGALHMAEVVRPRFLVLYLVPVLLHALWDLCAFEIKSDALLFPLLALLILVAWAFIVRLINMGFKQEPVVSAAIKQAEEAAAAYGGFNPYQ